MADKAVSLETLGNGAAVERFNYELGKVIENIADLNTKADAVRSVTLKVSIKPNEERDFSIVQIDVSSKTASIRAEMTSMFFVNRGGKLVAVEHNPKQARLPMDREVETE